MQLHKQSLLHNPKLHRLYNHKMVRVWPMPGQVITGLLLLGVIIVSLTAPPYASAQIMHRVGGKLRWSLEADLEGWSSSRSSHVGDFLEFIYTPQHNVTELSDLGFRNCDYTSPLGSYSGGRNVIVLDKPGFRYFACAFYEGCVMTLEVKVLPKA